MPLIVTVKHDCWMSSDRLQWYWETKKKKKTNEMKLFWLLPLPLPADVLYVISVRNTALSHALVLWWWNLPVIRWCHTSWPAPPLPPRMGTGYWGVSRSIRSGFLTPACWNYAAFSWGNTKKGPLWKSRTHTRYHLHYQNTTAAETTPKLEEKTSDSPSFTLFIELG